MAERTADREEVDLNEGFIDKEHEPTCHGPIVKRCICWRSGKSSHNLCNCVIVSSMRATIWGKRCWNRWFLHYSIILSRMTMESWRSEEFVAPCEILIMENVCVCVCIIKYIFGHSLHFFKLTNKNLSINDLERKLFIFYYKRRLFI